MIRLKRAYEPVGAEDGYRVLVDLLWPRGLKKSDLQIDEWVKEVAPSTRLRKSFSHDPGKWNEFRANYRMELRAPAARVKLEELARLARRSRVTLVYAARDEVHNNALVLKSVLERMIKTGADRKRTSSKAA